MIDAEKPLFLQAIGKLAIALREKEPDVVQLRVYFDALKDLDIAFVSAAAERLALGAEWFPKTSEWREMAETIRTERLAAQKEALRKARVPVCQVCDDTGWELLSVVERGQPMTRAKPCACRADRRRELHGDPVRPALLPGDPA